MNRVIMIGGILVALSKAILVKNGQNQIII